MCIASRFCLSKFALALALLLPVVPSAAVRFEYESKSAIPAASVTVAGSFNGWSTNSNPLMRDDVRFWTDLSLSDGEYSYKFHVIDEIGNVYWMIDSANPAYWPDSEGNINNYMKVCVG
jgi:1,4-alpha-glucan branching enzyme